ncbi:DUF4124 domain-containing protein [Shewanella cyperi]|uniref:DUF4124 domain-containing protein n=1 Tax=Shewanella cyperi TaxID=2814292 RepID=A0A974XMB6_9GAMM|nr:DUF4124 domain-containing protein [Shewanella cyperi]QSX29908.1 DUF4124 domain-containing protein [Shewanella cyperi]QSX40686.1 DUF4124 domain-containing protein [Shewanella cyperi]
MRIFTLTLLLLAGLCQAAVYKWVDKDGKVHYSDEPKGDAQLVEPKENTQNQISVRPPVDLSAGKQSPAAHIEYQLSILSPEHEETIRNNDGNFSVRASIDPEPPKGALWVLRLDGKVWQDPTTSPFFQLENIDRGEHSIQVQLITQNGKVLASSHTRTLFLHRATLLQAPQPVQPKAG